MSSNKLKSDCPKVLYALCASDGEKPDYQLVGLESAPVYVIDKDGLRAVVSDTEGGRLRPDRRSIGAHQSVLHALTETGTVLPIRFGVVARSAKAVEDLLIANQKTIKKHLEQLDGRVEMGLRVSWDVANIYEYYVETHPVLKQGRDEIWNRNANPGDLREEKIRLGNLYQSLRDADRLEFTEKVKNILVNYCEDIIETEVKREKDVMNLACLVKRDKLDEFAKGIFDASKLFDNAFLFDYTGPWAPHNFTTLNLYAPVSKKGKNTEADDLSGDL